MKMYLVMRKSEIKILHKSERDFREQPRCPTTGEWIMKMLYICGILLNTISAIKKMKS